jgi:hypothetical protein
LYSHAFAHERGGLRSKGYNRVLIPLALTALLALGLVALVCWGLYRGVRAALRYWRS